jgi:hypothetical protein
MAYDECIGELLSERKVYLPEGLYGTIVKPSKPLAL